MGGIGRDVDGINLIVWSDSGIAKVRAVPEDNPERIEVGGRVFQPYFVEDSLYFWGVLRDPKGTFVGFDVHIVKDREIIRSPFASATRGVWVDPNPERPFSLFVLLCDTAEYHVGGEEAFPVDFYSDGVGDFLLYFEAVDQWIGPENRFGFDLES